MQYIQQVNRLNAFCVLLYYSNLVKHTTVDLSIGIPTGLTMRMIQSVDSYKKTLAEAGITTVYGMWVDGGYGDQWQLTASVYGGQLILQSDSKYTTTLTKDISIHIFGI